MGPKQAPRLPFMVPGVSLRTKTLDSIRLRESARFHDPGKPPSTEAITGAAAGTAAGTA